MLSFARWSMRHRRAIVGLWVVVLVGSLGWLSGAVGNHFSDSSSLPGTGSQRASDLLSSQFRAQAGDTDQIVFRVRTGKLSDPPVTVPIDEMLARVRRLPHVTGVISPYAGGTRYISRSGTIGFATVMFNKRSDSLPVASINRVVSVARSIGSSRLEVELGGPAISRPSAPAAGRRRPSRSAPRSLCCC